MADTEDHEEVLSIGTALRGDSQINLLFDCISVDEINDYYDYEDDDDDNDHDNDDTNFDDNNIELYSGMAEDSMQLFTYKRKSSASERQQLIATSVCIVLCALAIPLFLEQWRASTCACTLDTNGLFQQIRGHAILNQDEALHRLKLALRDEAAAINEIAVAGPLGVGKRMFMHALHEHFPWRANVHTYAWSTHVGQEVEKFRMLRLLAGKVSQCGCNLLVVYNLAPCDYEVVSILNTLLADMDDADKKRVIVIYIFQLTAVELALPPHLVPQTQHQSEANSQEASILPQNPSYVCAENLEKLMNQANTKFVGFRAFGVEELHDCIRQQAVAGNITLYSEEISLIAETIDVQRTGCSEVAARLAQLEAV